MESIAKYSRKCHCFTISGASAVPGVSTPHEVQSLGERARYDIRSSVCLTIPFEVSHGFFALSRNVLFIRPIEDALARKVIKMGHKLEALRMRSERPYELDFNAAPAFT